MTLFEIWTDLTVIELAFIVAIQTTSIRNPIYDHAGKKNTAGSQHNLEEYEEDGQASNKCQPKPTERPINRTI